MLALGKYSQTFEAIDNGCTKCLKDDKSDKNSYLPIKVIDDCVYVAETDGRLIPNILGQQKCDYMLYCVNKPQTCFVELKGANISAKSDYNPYDQIIATIGFLKNDEDLIKLVDDKTEKHAFIVSPGRQKIPKGIETKERQLWKMLVQKGVATEIYDLIHYVKVTKSDRYSNNKSIICSNKSPIEIPFKK